MDEKAKKLRREYHKEWRKKNKELVKKYNAQHWERKAQKQESTKEETQ